jgi:catechol 2,3-dioxygenase-like lactoylglutathione lyase family enzyme
VSANNPQEVSMSSTDATDGSTAAAEAGTVEMRLEAVVVPVADVDRAKRFYERLGWRLDADFASGEDVRIVQFTPRGSAASIHFGTGITKTAPGSLERVVLVVEDIEAARADLVARGVDVSEVFHGEDGLLHHAGTAGRVPGPDPEGASYGSGASFNDPDGNVWLLQEITERLPGR